jgi:hypothetical protein
MEKKREKKKITKIPANAKTRSEPIISVNAHFIFEEVHQQLKEGLIL